MVAIMLSLVLIVLLLVAIGFGLFRIVQAFMEDY